MFEFTYESLTLKPIGPESASVVQEIYQNSPTYFLRVDGCEPKPGAGLKDILDTPPKEKLTEDYTKVSALILFQSRPIGYADLHVHYRTRGMAYLGLLILNENVQKRGLGRKSYQLVEKYLSQRFGIHKIYLGVSDCNQVQAYWEKMGFVPNGFVYKWKGENLESNVTEMEKEIL